MVWKDFGEIVWGYCGNNGGSLFRYAVEILCRDCVTIAGESLMECRDSGERLWVECG